MQHLTDLVSQSEGGTTKDEDFAEEENKHVDNIW